MFYRMFLARSNRTLVTEKGSLARVDLKETRETPGVVVRLVLLDPLVTRATRVTRASKALWGM